MSIPEKELPTSNHVVFGRHCSKCFRICLDDWKFCPACGNTDRYGDRFRCYAPPQPGAQPERSADETECDREDPKARIGSPEHTQAEAIRTLKASGEQEYGECPTCRFGVSHGGKRIHRPGCPVISTSENGTDQHD